MPAKKQPFKHVDPDRLFNEAEGEEVVRPTDFWKPEEEGASVVGLVRGKRNSKYGPICTLDVPDGKPVMVGLNPVLQDMIGENMVGEFILLQYIGDVPTGGGDMRNFRVKVVSETTAKHLAKLIADADLPF